MKFKFLGPCIGGLLFLQLGTIALAQDSASTSSSSEKSSVYRDFYVFGGYTSVEMAGMDSMPTLGTYGIGATYSYYFFSGIFLGLFADYRYLAQYSDFYSRVGSFKGTRYNLLGPVLGIDWDKFLIKLDYQLLGNYDLSNPTPSQETVSYTQSAGARLSFLWSSSPRFNLGFYYERVEFSRQIINGNVIALVSPLIMAQFGLLVNYVY